MREATDKDLFGTFLRGHLSLNSLIFNQILPQIASFHILGTWDENSGKWSILDDFGRKYDEFGKVLNPVRFLHLTVSGIQADAVRHEDQDKSQKITHVGP